MAALPLWRATTPKFATISAVAQFAYMVLFSYSFFFEGLTGITITIGAIITLALLKAAKSVASNAAICDVPMANTCCVIKAAV